MSSHLLTYPPTHLLTYLPTYQLTYLQDRTSVDGLLSYMRHLRLIDRNGWQVSLSR